jgi:hypothetical protein
MFMFQALRVCRFHGRSGRNPRYSAFARWDDPDGQLELWFGVGGGAAGGLCGGRDGYIHPDFPHGPPPSVTPSGAAQGPYSLATPSASSGYGCHSVTRT